MDVSVLHFDWNWQLESAAEKLWPLISDTNRMNKNLNLPPVQNSTISYDLKKGHTQLSYNTLQNSDAWEEEPYEWEHPYRFGVKRHYKNGSYRDVKLQVDLLPNSAGTRIRYQIWATARNLLAYYLKSMNLNLFLRRKLKNMFKAYDQLVQQGLLPHELESQEKLARGGHERIETCREKLNVITGKPQIVSKLIEFISKADEIDVARIHPYKLADHWNYPRQDVLTVFLHATKNGLLNFRWDLYCPSCRSLQKRCSSLREITKLTYCTECKERFYVNFNHRIQLSFLPNPLIRKISPKNYCLTGPQTKSHIAIKQNLAPSQQRYLKLNLPEGNYTLRILGQEGTADVEVSEDGEDNISIVLNQSGLNGEQVSINPDPNLVFQNNTDKNQVFVLENKAWDKDQLSAAEVTSLQLFRELFDKEVLRKGKKIAVDNLTLMFTDLYDSTGMYDKEGDEAAVVRVIEHFEILKNAIAQEQGGIVKTIGDSVMAVFKNPTNAYRAFVKAHEEIANHKQYGQHLKLKAGIHHGSCVAVNLNGNIDYFGSTVNIASRLVDFADEDEILFTKSVHDMLDHAGVLDRNYRTQDLKITLRGFENEEFDVKRLTIQTSPLRLVV